MQIPQDASAADFRRHLMHIEDPNAAPGTSYLMEHIEVSRGQTPTGYYWDVTFVGDKADVPALVIDASNVRSASGCNSADPSRTDCITNTLDPDRNTDGRRRAGSSAIQVIELTDNTLNNEVPSGFFRVRAGGSSPSVWLQAGCDPEHLRKALTVIESVRSPIDVSIETIGNSSTSAGGSPDGFRYIITFAREAGSDVPLLQVDGSLLVGSSAAVGTVFSASNELTNTTRRVCEACRPGELPPSKGSVVVPPDQFSYRTAGLVAGTAYAWRVSAINALGAGAPAAATCSPAGAVFCNLAEQAPMGAVAAAQEATAVLRVPLQKPGTPENVTLAVDPTSSSRLLLDYDAPQHDGGAAILGYRLEWSESADYGPGGQVRAKTERCAIDAAHEVVTVSTTSSAAITNGTFRLRVWSEGNVTEALSEPLRFDAQALSSEEDAAATVGSGSGVFCVVEDSSIVGASNRPCDENPVSNPGSMQSHLNYLESVVGAEGVNVERTDLGSGAHEWAITFMGDVGNVQVAVADNRLTSADGSPVSVSAAIRTEGEREGTLDCLSEKTLTQLLQGRPYYARVTAYNRVGYGESTAAISRTDPSRSFVAPVRVPGRVRAASLTVVSGTQLRVTWSPPQDDGGSAITEYRLRYADNRAMTGFQETSLLYIPDGGPYSKTLSGLVPGRSYWVLVYAVNAQGVGEGQGPTPLFEFPRSLPMGPINVRAQATSPTMISVGFGMPLDNGGDNVTAFVAEWDVDPEFESLALAPHKGKAEVRAAASMTYTIRDLQPGQLYYVRVSAVNRVGEGLPTLPSPAGVAPARQLPGKPTSVVLASSLSNPSVQCGS